MELKEMKLKENSIAKTTKSLTSICHYFKPQTWQTPTLKLNFPHCCHHTK